MLSMIKKAEGVRDPLLPLMAQQFLGLSDLATRASCVVNEVIDFPQDRAKTRVVCGVLIPALHKLVEIAPDYATVRQ